MVRSSYFISYAKGSYLTGVTSFGLLKGFSDGCVESKLQGGAVLVLPGWVV